MAESDDEAVGGMTGPDGPLLRLFKDRRFAFLVVGGINTAMGFVWFALFSMLFRGIAGADDDWMVFLIILCSQVTSVVCAYFLYRYLVFRVRGHFWLDFGRFALVYVVPFALNFVVVPALTIWTGMHEIVAQLLYTAVFAVVSWFAHSRFSFRRSDKEKQS